MRAAVLLVALAGCSLVGPQQVVVSSPSSLAEAMVEIEATFESDHPDTDLIVNLGGSQELAAEVIAGAPADLLIGASPDTIRIVADAGFGLGDTLPLTRNRIAIVVPDGNPDRVDDLADLVALDVVLGEVGTPLGRYGQAVLDAAGVDLRPVAREPSARAVVARVAAGDADAALAFSTDVPAVAGVAGVLVPAELQPDVAYEMVLLDEAAADLLAFLASTEARQILRRFGFVPAS